MIPTDDEPANAKSSTCLNQVSRIRAVIERKGSLETGSSPVAQPQLNHASSNLLSGPDRYGLTGGRRQGSIGRVHRKDHPVISVPPGIEPRYIVIKNTLGCGTLDLNESDFVRRDVFDFNVDSLRRAAELRQSRPTGTRQDQIYQQFKVLISEAGNKLNNSVPVSLTR